MPGYMLTVAKGGSKLRESVVDPAAKPVLTLASCRLGKDQDGFPQIAPGCRGQLNSVTSGAERITGGGGGGAASARVQSVTSGAIRTTARQVPLDSLVRELASNLNVSPERIVDQTGLTGNYDYRLGFSRTGLSANASAGQDPSGLPDLFAALQEQLGLKLEKTKLSINMVIVDHADKVPAQN